MGDTVGLERPGDARDRARVEGEVAARLFGDTGARLRIGRFEVRGRLGAGGLGVVYRAFDPKLEREVALKLLRGTGNRASLLDEAKALARLAHPNVVAVFEAGESQDGDVFVAMERVEGDTLGAFLRTTKPDPSRAIALFVEAGRGLAAAHAAGVVHGDFKPDNVLVGRDGRVRVTDFGLARIPDPLRDDRGGPPSGGTPAYMAPEQRSGRGPSPASDQHAFCASLVEGLTGAVPEPGRAVGPLPGIPGPVAGAITQGLSTDPTLRFSTMDALLAALAPDRPSRLRRVVAWTIAAVLVAVVVAGSVVQARMYFDYRDRVLDAQAR